MLRLHDTALGRPVELVTRQPGQMSMYVCGPTVYDIPHLGHGRHALVFDILRRYLEWSGNRVTYASNITDIDDRIIQRANEQGRSAADVAVQYEEVWWDAIDRLGIERPTHDPHATAYVEEMVALVAGLTEARKAYETSDGVYLSVDTVPDYGLLAGQPLDSLRAGARVDVVEEKLSSLDFALWKKAKPDEPAWPSPWGDGRPGWHTECVVMSLDLLGDGFELHGGGQDLIFPHHENERAQAVASGRDFARHWAHHGWVEVGGEKMSKSLGNFTSLVDLLDSADARAYRLLVLMSHYRAPVEITGDTVRSAENALERLDDFARRTADVAAVPPDTEAMDAFRRHMDDDLDTPAVVAQAFELVRATNSLLDAGDHHGAAPLVAAAREITAAVGLTLAGGGDTVDAVTADLMDRRDAARAARDFAAADTLRSELEAAGWVVEDTPAGTRVHRRQR